MSPQEEKALSDIASHGCHIIHVMPEGELPGYSYTIGIERSSGAPEVIIIGLKPDISQFILNEYHRRVKAGEAFAVGEFYRGFLEGFELCFQRVDTDHYREHLGWAMWLYEGTGFSCLQAVYPTTMGQWPWDDTAASKFRSWQPLLTASGSREL